MPRRACPSPWLRQISPRSSGTASSSFRLTADEDALELAISDTGAGMDQAHLDRIFLPNYLLSQAQVINILPGERAQPLHPDDAFYAVPRPRPPLGAATVWAIDEFTEDNGATVVVPRSHQWGDDRKPGPDDESVSAVMPAGSVIFYPGTVWHGGGENRSPEPRLAVTCQYCEPWLRTQENYFLSVSRETVRTLSEDLKRLLGYSIHPPFMGMVNGMHPKRSLEAGPS